MHFRCAGIFNDSFITNFPQSVSVKEFSKSVFVVYFSDHGINVPCQFVLSINWLKLTKKFSWTQEHHQCCKKYCQSSPGWKPSLAMHDRDSIDETGMMSDRQVTSKWALIHVSRYYIKMLRRSIIKHSRLASNTCGNNETISMTATWMFSAQAEKLQQIQSTDKNINDNDKLQQVISPVFGPGRRVPKSYCSCSSCSCCCYQFSEGPKIPKAFLIRSVAQRNFAHTHSCWHWPQIYCLRLFPSS